jgi:hypothetical protein
MGFDPEITGYIVYLHTASGPPGSQNFIQMYITNKLGYGSAIVCTSTFAIWIISFTAIAVSGPLFFWTDLEAYISHATANSKFFPILAKSFMLVFSLSYPVLILSLMHTVDGEQRILGATGMLFASLFSLVSALHYYIQVSTVRFALDAGNPGGLEPFVQANPHSFLSAANMLGWSLFLGLSCLFMHAALRKREKMRLMSAAFLAGGISGLLAGAGYLLQVDILTFVFVNLGMGGALLIICIASMRFFRIRRE